MTDTGRGQTHETLIAFLLNGAGDIPRHSRGVTTPGAEGENTSVRKTATIAETQNLYETDSGQQNRHALAVTHLAVTQS